MPEEMLGVAHRESKKIPTSHVEEGNKENKFTEITYIKTRPPSNRHSENQIGIQKSKDSQFKNKQLQLKFTIT